MGNKRKMQIINRFAVTLEPTDKFQEWVNSLTEQDDALSLQCLCEDCTVLLIPETYKSVDEWAQKNYRIVMENELSGWCMDPKLWPENLSYKIFKKFFNMHIHSMVIDLGNDPIAYEE